MRSKFFDKETHYHLGRPDHHPAVVAFLEENFDAGKTVLEIGAGSGLGTKMLAGYFDKVIAIEPVKDLADKGPEIFNQDHVELYTKPIEETGALDFDYLICFQATHWFYQTAQYQQFYAHADKPVLDILSRIVPLDKTEFFSELISEHTVKTPERGFDYPHTVVAESSYETEFSAEQTAHGICSGASIDHGSFDAILNAIKQQFGSEPIRTSVTTKVCDIK